MNQSRRKLRLIQACWHVIALWLQMMYVSKHQVNASVVDSSASDSTMTKTATILGRLILPDSNLAPLNSTLITLNDGEYTTYSTGTDGSFKFYNIPPGIHVLDVRSNLYHFSQIKIQLLPENDMVPNCIEYIYPGATKYTIKHPLILTAHATYDYFEKRPSFSPFRIFKNPMVLMMVVSIGMMVLMPYMMQNLDPEQKEQMKKQMEMQQDPSKMLSQMWGELSGKSIADEKKKTAVRKGNKTRLKRE